MAIIFFEAIKFIIFLLVTKIIRYDTIWLNNYTQSDEDEIESGSDDDDNEIIANNNQNTPTKSAKNIQIENKENAKAKKKDRRIETPRKILETANINIKKTSN